MKNIEVKLTICNPEGLHARTSARFVKYANKFESKITVLHENHKADGKSILDLLTLEAKYGSIIIIKVSGKDAPQAIETLSALVKSGFNSPK